MKTEGMNKTKIKVGVVSDVVCPWCYIGKRRLENAMHQLSDKYDFEVEYFPFELNPQTPAEGFDQKEYLTNKFGGEERYEKLTGNVTNLATQEGLTFRYDLQKKTPNTRNAHRLIMFAKEDGKHLEMVEAFFKAYFTQGTDLSKIENLISLATNVGLDQAKVEALLKSDVGTVEVEMAEIELQKLGITGVPFYILDNKYGISGAQPSQEFIKAFDDLNAEITASSGEACDVNDKNC
jgi:predicted DsbA family dithiol-disulfide isomerase